ncbi:hypothetical protein [Amycolatopsis anabasis]|uniref:hypothetical protein n=1 Tax=Amycolatopsis anabasis TaxID=1840409 RepID=UPI00131B7756|nr:hypothetical protein [Amycolatopsis anabasis]
MADTEVRAQGRSTREVLSRSRALVDPALRAAVGGLPESTRRVAGYQFGWWDEHGRGARPRDDESARPALVLLAAEAIGGVPADAVPAAVAIELAHTALRLHGEVIAGDPPEGACGAFGAGRVILTGGAVLTLAFDVLATGARAAVATGTRMLSAAVQETGELDARRADALLGCACALGAVFGGGRPAQIARLRGFGERLTRAGAESAADHLAGALRHLAEAEPVPRAAAELGALAVVLAAAGSGPGDS